VATPQEDLPSPKTSCCQGNTDDFPNSPTGNGSSRAEKSSLPPESATHGPDQRNREALYAGGTDDLACRIIHAIERNGKIVGVATPQEDLPSPKTSCCQGNTDDFPNSSTGNGSSRAEKSSLPPA
jgi:hypothetical protein